MFGIGGSASSSRSQSSSQEYGYSKSGSSSLSDSSALSRSTSGSTSTTSGVGRSFTDIAFEDIFADLYAKAGGAAGRVAAAAPGFTEQTQALFSGGVDFLDTLGGGDAYLESRRDGTNPLLEEQIGLLGEDLGAFFREELNPAITSRAVAGGTLGGGRQGVAQGRAAAAVGEQFRRGATELRAGDMAQRDAAARALLENRTTGAGIGLNALPGLAGIAQSGFGAELAPWESLAAILGGPTTLAGSEQVSSGQSSSFSEATAEEVARAIASSFGLSEDFATSQSTSKSKSASFKI